MNEVIEQRSEKWIKDRLGKPTASQFHRILTDKGNVATSQANTYKWQLVAEQIFGVSFAEKIGYLQPVKDGIANEGPAREALSRFLKVPIKAAGFVFSQDRRWGCSPDGWVGNRPVEIKCPQLPGHLEILAVGPRKYWPQLQGQMLVTGANQLEFWSWNPYATAAYWQVPRDEAFCNSLHYELTKFCNALEEASALVRAKGRFDIEAFLALREEDAANNPE